MIYKGKDKDAILVKLNKQSNTIVKDSDTVGLRMELQSLRNKLEELTIDAIINHVPTKEEIELIDEYTRMIHKTERILKSGSKNELLELNYELIKFKKEKENYISATL